MKIPQAILHTLDRVPQNTMRERVLIMEVQLLSSGTATEISRELRKVEEKKWIVGVTDELDPLVVLWKLTAQGRAVLAEHEGGA